MQLTKRAVKIRNLFIVKSTDFIETNGLELLEANFEKIL